MRPINRTTEVTYILVYTGDDRMELMESFTEFKNAQTKFRNVYKKGNYGPAVLQRKTVVTEYETLEEF